MHTEPVATGASIQILLTALIALALGFGWVSWTTDQTALILGVYAATQAVIGALQRSRVTPVV